MVWQTSVPACIIVLIGTQSCTSWRHLANHVGVLSGRRGHGTFPPLPLCLSETASPGARRAHSVRWCLIEPLRLWVCVSRRMVGERVRVADPGSVLKPAVCFEHYAVKPLPCIVSHSSSRAMIESIQHQPKWRGTPLWVVGSLKPFIYFIVFMCFCFHFFYKTILFKWNELWIFTCVYLYILLCFQIVVIAAE